MVKNLLLFNLCVIEIEVSPYYASRGWSTYFGSEKAPGSSTPSIVTVLPYFLFVDSELFDDILWADCPFTSPTSVYDGYVEQGDMDCMVSQLLIWLSTTCDGIGRVLFTNPCFMISVFFWYSSLTREYFSLKRGILSLSMKL